MEIPGCILLIIFSLSGFTLKVADLSGELGLRALGLLSAGVCGVFLGILITESRFSSAIVLGIIVGVAIAGKINQVNLIAGLAVTTLTALVLGFVTPSIWLLVAVAFFAVLDEVLHGRFAGRHGPLAKFFSYRCCLKVAMLALVVLAFLPLLYAVGFIVFDLTYDVAQAIFSRLRTMPRLRKLGW